MMGVGLLLSLIGAAGAVKFTRPVVIGLSAFSGGTKAVHTLLPVFGVANPTILWVGGTSSGCSRRDLAAADRKTETVAVTERT